MIDISVLEALVEAGVSAAQLLTAVKAMNSSTCHEAEPRGAFDVARERYICLREGDDDHDGHSVFSRNESGVTA